MSAGVVPLASAARGLAQLEGRRSQACRCSRGRRRSGSDSEARDRLGVPPQRHPSGVGDPLTRTPPRRACRPQTPLSPLVAHAHRGPTPPDARYHRPSPCAVAWTGRRALASPAVARGPSSDRAGEDQLTLAFFAVRLVAVRLVDLL